MARRPRLQYRGAIYHVMARGNRKSAIFAHDHDRERFLDIVGTAAERYEIRSPAFCLMGNHYHLAVDTPRGNLSAAMRYINGVYAQYSNRRHQQTGHVFEGRFTSVLVENDVYLRNLVAYIVLNPVKAGLVKNVAEWKWSSYAATAGLSAAPPFLTLDWMEWLFESRCRRDSQRKYCDLVGASPEWEPEFSVEGLLVGSPSFEGRVRSHIGATLYQIALPRVYRSIGRPPLVELFTTVGNREQRSAIIQRAHVVHGYRLSEIARFLGLHPNSVSRLLCQLKARSRFPTR